MFTCTGSFLRFVCLSEIFPCGVSFSFRLTDLFWFYGFVDLMVLWTVKLEKSRIEMLRDDLLTLTVFDILGNTLISLDEEIDTTLLCVYEVWS